MIYNSLFTGLKMFLLPVDIQQFLHIRDCRIGKSICSGFCNLEFFRGSGFHFMFFKWKHSAQLVELFFTQFLAKFRISFVLLPVEFSRPVVFKAFSYDVQSSPRMILNATFCVLSKSFSSPFVKDGCQTTDDCSATDLIYNM